MGPINQWKYYNQFLSAPTCQRYLKSCYEQLGTVENVDELGYRNCYSFLYYLTHGRRHYDLAEVAPLELQPVLQYYGVIQLIKCCLLTVDPLYPESTSLLAHGLTTRKRKKQNYLFLEDEIKIQRNGLFPYFSEKLFHMKQLEGDKFQMYELLGQLPDLYELFGQLKRRSRLVEVEFFKEDGAFRIPGEILDRLHMTPDRFSSYISPYVDTIVNVDSSMMAITRNDRNSYEGHALFKRSLEGGWFFPTTRECIPGIHEVMIHYLLLYNLSMICRYETEWWSELFHTYASDDYPFISRFLEVSKKKIPHLLLDYLHRKIR